LNDTSIRLTDSEDKLRQLENYVERMKDNNGKTISSNDELKENLKRSLERINSLQLKVEVLMRESDENKKEIVDLKQKLEKNTQNNTLSIEKQEEEHKSTIKNLSADFNSILTEKESTEQLLNQQLEKEKHKYKSNMNELNAQIKSLSSQLQL